MHDLAVQAGGQGLGFDIGYVIGGDHPGAEGAGADKVLAGGELVRVTLPVADGAVVVAGVAGHVIKGIFSLDVAAGAANNQGQLAFVIKGGGNTGYKNGVAVSDLAGGKTYKNGRVLLNRTAGFLAVGFVIQADADDFVGVGDNRQKFDFMNRQYRCNGQCRLGVSQTGAAQQGTQVGVAVAQNGPEVGNMSVVDLGAVTRLAVSGHKRKQSHGYPL